MSACPSCGSAEWGPGFACWHCGYELTLGDERVPDAIVQAVYAHPIVQAVDAEDYSETMICATLEAAERLGFLRAVGPDLSSPCMEDECEVPACALVAGHWYCLRHLRDLAQRLIGDQPEAAA